MIIGQMFSCGLDMTHEPKKPAPIALKSKAWKILIPIIYIQI
jgi:hypothetical protein